MADERELRRRRERDTGAVSQVRRESKVVPMKAIPGLLYVTMQPLKSLSDAQFHDWYNNEHGPLRLRLPFCTNGFRYRATDISATSPASNSLPEWLAIYDITDMAEMNKPAYLSLRGDTIKTPREKATMAQIVVGRKLFDLVSDVSAPGFLALDTLSPPAPSPATATVLIARSMVLKAGVKDAEEKFNAWYEQEHVPMLMKVPGWQRTRRYVTSSVLEGKEGMEYVALHEYLPVNGLGGEEFKAATSTEWRDKIFEGEGAVVESSTRRTYELYYVFGPAPRELTSLASPDTTAWNSIDKKTFTYPAAIPKGEGEGIPALDSFVTTPDGITLPYRLSGSADPNAPLIILINSILVTHGIWDTFIASFLSSPFYKTHKTGFRILRYNSRGRSALPSTKSTSDTPAADKEITMDVLAADAISLLDALRVQTAAAVIGVSVGGATSLNVALKYPSRVRAWIACDFNCNSSPGNVQAWEDRIALATNDDSTPAPSAADAATGRIVGEKLAEATVRRWFVPQSYDGGATEKEIVRVKEMVRTNSLPGFARGVRALYEYDLRPDMEKSALPGLLIVGSGDGALPGAMEGMRAKFGKVEGGVQCVVLESAGHLPMVEKPEEFAAAVTEFLAKV